MVVSELAVMISSALKIKLTDGHVIKSSKMVDVLIKTSSKFYSFGRI